MTSGHTRSPFYMSRETDALRHFLNAQRAGVPAILNGLTELQLRTPVLPSGWTPLGLVQHIGDAEHHWFQEVALGKASPRPRPYDLATAAPAEVMAFYRSQCELSDAVLAATPLDARPLGHHGEDVDDDVTDLRWIVLHMIEETARHLGHLDTARELLDGSTGLAPR
ncbi:DinB family protein [Streptomyces sp. NPDC016845]|uniref:DinB family protein n=1 Tax=Streptomyces sp. NPDC016845 TaxID=3364972 RepID=UPI00379B0AB4